jgi:hypothetical protein
MRSWTCIDCGERVSWGELFCPEGCAKPAPVSLRPAAAPRRSTDTGNRRVAPRPQVAVEVA